MKSGKIRLATNEDFEEILVIIKNLYEQENFDWLKRSLTFDFKEESIYKKWYVYEIGKEIVGAISIRKSGSKKTLEIAQLAVRPEYQGREIGSQLMDFSKKIAKKEKLEKMVANSDLKYSSEWYYKSNASKFYEKNGFNKLGIFLVGRNHQFYKFELKL
jgi:N-acetylglutamate synthase-like GNAT family acetyltransferase